MIIDESNIIGKTICILQGGGMRQIENATGVLLALKESNIKIDYYIGSSAGGIVAALAVSKSPEKLEKIIRTTPASSLYSFNWKMLIPFYQTHLYNRTGMENLISKNYNAKCISVVDVTMTNNKTYESVIVNATPNTLLATSAIPEVFAPVQVGKEMYVDGGCIDNISMVPVCDIPKYKHIYIILCNDDIEEASPPSFLKSRRSLAAMAATMKREEHDIITGYKDIPNVTIIKPSPFKSSLLDWSEGNTLIDHAKNYTLKLLKNN